MEHALFKHLPNKRGGGFDSICMGCFAVVAVGRYGSQITRFESRHKCDEARVEDLKVWLNRLRLI